MARIAVLAMVLGTTVAGGARAQPTAPDTGYIGQHVDRLEIDDCPPPPDVPPDRLAKLPGEQFDRGTTLYNQGDYDGATRELISAYCLSPYYSVLKSIGLAFERELEFEKAIAYFMRYVLAIPADVKVIDGVSVADEKAATSSHVTVLGSLVAQIQVSTDPPNAEVTLSSDTGARANGHSNGKLIEVPAGKYTMTVELEGYQSKTVPIEVRIGKPYSRFYQLDRLRGRLKIQATPADARILLEGKLVGQGVYDDELARGGYHVVVEAPGRVSAQRDVEVAANATAEISIDLPPPRENGRWQLVIASGVAGASLGGVALSAGSTDKLVLGVGAFGAAAAAVAGAYFGIPDDYPLGSSSFIITSGMAGGGEGLFITQLFSGDTKVASTVTGLGVIVGASAAVLTADRFDFSPGDAALVNTGALWGTVVGALFAASYDDGTTRGRKIGAGLTLTGLNVGLVGGVLLGRNFDISRRHAALIDLAGITGAAAAAAIQGVIDSGRTNVPRERQANFALAGVTVGLLAGAYLTRNMDAPRIPRFKPTVIPIKGSDGKVQIGLGVRGDL